ncbi:ribose-phosphate diphosphokinase [Candidatus Woesearchaeota archaeon]|nr:ribose-phosphate diphosphokinase [Candidatus Woesearchaeota archaeon]
MTKLENVLVFAGTDDEKYVDDVCTLLDLERGKLESRYHSDSDPYFRILERDVGGKDVYFISRFHNNTLHNLMEMLNFANAALHEGAHSVNVFETYLGCSRQERKSKPGEAVTLQVKANCIMTNGINTFSTFTAHSDATILAFDPSRTRFMNFQLWPPLIRVISKIAGEEVLIKPVAPDAGAAKPVREILNSTTVQQDERFVKDLALVDKDRVHQNKGKSKSGALIGDVTGVIAALFDDESVTAGSMCDAAKICRENGSIGTYVNLAHAKFMMNEIGTDLFKNALEQGIIDRLIMTNSCYLPPDLYEILGLHKDSEKLIVIPTQPLVAEFIRRSAENKGVPYLFSSRGVLGPYENIANRVKFAERRERDEDYEKRFKSELKLYKRLAEPVLGPYKPMVRSHRKLTESSDEC